MSVHMSMHLSTYTTRAIGCTPPTSSSISCMRPLRPLNGTIRPCRHRRPEPVCRRLLRPLAPQLTRRLGPAPSAHSSTHRTSPTVQHATLAVRPDRLFALTSGLRSRLIKSTLMDQPVPFEPWMLSPVVCAFLCVFSFSSSFRKFQGLTSGQW